jgi:diguanylate cyclase (GGDEF)-like protein
VILVIFHALAPESGTITLSAWFGAALAMMAAAVACSFRVALLGWFRGTRPDRSSLSSGIVMVAVAAINATLTFLALRLVVADARLAWLVGALAVVLVVVYRNYISLLNHHEGLNRLYESTQTLDLVRAQEGSIRGMLDQALDLLGAEVAELTVSLSDGDDARRFRATRTEGVRALDPDDGGGISPETLALLSPAGDSDGDTDRFGSVESNDQRTLQATLQGSAGPLAVLRVATDRGVTFSEADRRLFEMFVNHASVALQNSQLVDQLRDEVAQREHEALHDALTALPNRVMFDLQTRRALADRTGSDVVAVALIDIDHFKEVNDTLGHHHGDELLAELARRLDVLASDRDLVVSRLGGDEFAVLMVTNGGVEAVAKIAADVKAVIEESMEIADVRVDITASVGISVTDPDGPAVDGSTMLRQADVAMYIAKRQHLGTVFYDRTDDPYSPKRLSLAADLRHAVERGEIEAYFQPEIDLVTGDVISVEALARWTHREHGNIVPDQFIPIAEQSGLIRDLTYLMLEQSLERIRQWRSHGFDLHVAVNLSVRCLSDERLVDRVTRQLDLAGLGPDCLTLEVTEGTIMADPEHALAVLGRLHDRGIRLSIDDFGMGYSSLAQLKRMPVGQLKVDRSFVTYVSEDHDDAAIVKSVTELGHNLGLEVIAEGVEDQQTLDKLIELGCDSVQGFYLARPMSADQTLRWLRDRERQRREPGYDPKFATAQIV